MKLQWSHPVQRPAHYSSGRFKCECIDVTRHMSFPVGNAYKYIWRHKERNGKEDLDKAVRYLIWAQQDLSPVWISSGAKKRGEEFHYSCVERFTSGLYIGLGLIVRSNYIGTCEMIEELTKE